MYLGRANREMETKQGNYDVLCRRQQYLPTRTLLSEILKGQ